jgi:molecular chaperone DnaK (HSP70)
MSYKPDESTLMAYLYGELQGEEKKSVEKFLAENPEAMRGLQGMMDVRKILSVIEDKEVIAPPIVMEDSKQRYFWNAPYLKTVISVAASLMLLLVAGKVLDLRINYENNTAQISFGEPVTKTIDPVQPGLTAQQVQDMINNSVQNNNQIVQASWSESQKKIDASIRKNMAMNSQKFNDLVKEASKASEAQISGYVASLKNENQQLVKDYFKLTTNEQQKYIENLLVDFAKYMNQQRTSDLEAIQMRMVNMEQNTTLFKEETEQILSSIISNTPAIAGTKSY